MRGSDRRRGRCGLDVQPESILDIRVAGSVEILQPVELECHDTFDSGQATFVIPDILCIEVDSPSSSLLGIS